MLASNNIHPVTGGKTKTEETKEKEETKETKEKQEKIEQLFAIEFDKSVPDEALNLIKVLTFKKEPKNFSSTVWGARRIQDQPSSALDGKRSLILSASDEVFIIMDKEEAEHKMPTVGDSVQTTEIYKVKPNTAYIFELSEQKTSNLGFSTATIYKLTLKNQARMDFTPTTQELTTLATQYDYEKSERSKTQKKD